MPRIAIFIDGNNLNRTMMDFGLKVNFKRLLEVFDAKGTLVTANYYTPLRDNGEHNSLVKLIDWLAFNGYNVVTRPMTKHTSRETGEAVYRGTISVDLTTDAMELLPAYDHLHLFTGDGSYTRLVQAVQRAGRTVTVYSSISKYGEDTSPHAHETLRRQTNKFVDIAGTEVVAYVGKAEPVVA